MLTTWQWARLTTGVATTAHTFGNSSTPGNASTNPVVSASYTVTSGATVVVAMLVVGGATNRAGGAPTFGGVTMTQAGTTQKAVTSPESSTEIWYIVGSSIPTGASTLSIPNTGVLRIDYVMSSGKASAGKTSELDVAPGGKNTSTNPTVSVTTGFAGNITFSVVGSGAQTWAPTPQSGTLIYNTDFGTYGEIAQYNIHVAAATYSVSWTFATSDDWGACAASFKEVVAGLELVGTPAVNTWVGATGAISTIVNLAGVSAVSTWTVPLGTFKTEVVLAGTTAVNTWNAAAGAIGLVFPLTGATATTTWVVPTGALTTVVNLSGASANSIWNAAAGTLSTIVGLSGATAANTWNAAGGSITTVGGGTVTLAGDSAIVTWNVPAGALSTVVALSGVSASSSWVTPTGTLTLALPLTGSSAIINWVVPTGVFGLAANLSGASAVINWVTPTGSLVAFTTPKAALYQLYNLRARLDIKFEMDSGTIEAAAADVSGTAVLFNKPFKDVDSITVSVLSNIERRAVYDFIDLPNPTVFYVYVYNTAGARVDATVSWKARGKR